MLATITPEAIHSIVLYVLCLVMSVAVHEYCHARAAAWLGDSTPETDGRLTLNPVVHADPIGTLVIPVVAALSGFPPIGWGRPVETQPRQFSRRFRMRTGLAIVAAAGPFGNLLLAALVLGIAWGMNAAGLLHQPTALPLLTLVQCNLVLMVFNLLPVHPLDGGKVLAAWLPTRLEFIDDFSQQYGSYIVLALLFFGGSVLSYLFAPFYWIVGWAWQGLIG